MIIPNLADICIETFNPVSRSCMGVKLTHWPSGIVVECSSEKSPHKNYLKALDTLSKKLGEENER